MDTNNIVVHEDLSAQIAALKAENARLKAKAQAQATAKLSIKVKPLGGQDKDGNEFKGNVSVYGLGKYPVTLYPGQWLKLLSIADQIKDEIETYRDLLSWKD